MVMQPLTAIMMLLLITRASAFATLSPAHRANSNSLRLFASKTNISFDPTIDIRDKATSTIVIGRHSTLKTLIEQQDSYVSYFGFRPHPDILSSMHKSVTGNQATSSLVIVPTVGPAIPRPPHRLTLCSLQNKVTRNNHPLSVHSMSDMI